MRVGSFWTATAVVLLTAVQVAKAADGDTYADLCVSNIDAIRVSMMKKEKGGLVEEKELAPKDGEYQARISGRETLRINLCAINPVLYTYKAEQLPLRPSSDALALDQFVGLIGNAVGALSGTTVRTAAAASEHDAEASCDFQKLVSVEDVKLSELGDHLAALKDLHDRIPGYIERTHNPMDPKLDADKKMLAKDLADVRKLRSMVPGLQHYINAVRLERPTSLRFSATDGSETIYGSVEQFRQSRKPLTVACAAKVDGALNEKLRSVDSIAYGIGDLLAEIRTLENFNSAFQEVGTNKEVTSIPYNARGDLPERITIEKNAAFAELYSPTTRQFVDSGKKTDSFIVNTGPQLDFRLSVSPGAIYSFVRQPKFSAKSDGAGAFTIAQQESSYQAAGGLVAFNITRDKYMKELVRPFVQVGISPKKDELAFVLGVGLALDESNKTIFSMGAIYQERQKLGAGQTVGATLASEDDLKLDTEFKFGFYAGLSYNIELTK